MKIEKGVFAALCGLFLLSACAGTPPPPAAPVLPPTPLPSPVEEQVKPPHLTPEPPVIREQNKIVPVSELVVIGEVEPVSLLAVNRTLTARIDTGATTSSLDARDIQPFERDGKRWVRFTLPDRNGGEALRLEAAVVRRVEVKRHGAESVSRPVVRQHIQIGEERMLREFSLTNRADFAYPMLIGRNVLEGIFVVDVSLRNTASPMVEK